MSGQANVALRSSSFSPLRSLPVSGPEPPSPCHRRGQRGLGYKRNNQHGPRSTHPWPIFSKRVYFFLGSPTLTMLPVTEKAEVSKHGDKAHKRIYALSHRNGSKKLCISISCILFPDGCSRRRATSNQTEALLRSNPHICFDSTLCDAS